MVKMKGYDAVKERMERIASEDARFSERGLEVREVDKNGIIFLGYYSRDLSSKVSVSPVIYLPDNSEEYSDSTIADYVIRAYDGAAKNAEAVNVLAMSDMEVYENVYLAAANTRFLPSGVVHKKWKDTDIYFYLRLVLPFMSSEDNIASMAMNESLLDTYCEKFGIEDKDTFVKILFNKAKRNIAKDVDIQTVDNFLASLGFPGVSNSNVPMIMVSNEKKWYGAGVLACDEVFKGICEEYNVEQLVIIPSSVDEVIAIPVMDDIDIYTNGMAEIIKDINETMVEETKVLGFKPYVYDLNV